mgnify:CR=1 FL=1
MLILKIYVCFLCNLMNPLVVPGLLTISRRICKLLLVEARGDSFDGEKCFLHQFMHWRDFLIDNTLNFLFSGEGFHQLIYVFIGQHTASVSYVLPCTGAFGMRQ